MAITARSIGARRGMNRPVTSTFLLPPAPALRAARWCEPGCGHCRSVTQRSRSGCARRSSASALPSSRTPAAPFPPSKCLRPFDLYDYIAAREDCCRNLSVLSGARQKERRSAPWLTDYRLRAPRRDCIARCKIASVTIASGERESPSLASWGSNRRDMANRAAGFERVRGNRKGQSVSPSES